MSAAPDSPEHNGPWSMPSKFRPVPKEFSCATNSMRIDLRARSMSQLRALAAKHNSRSGIEGDPFQSTLKGIVERAKLRPDSKLATTDTIGTMLPADSPYVKAWKSIRRPAKQGKRADTAAKRAEPAKVGGKAASDPANRAAQRQPQQLVVPAEQTRWRAKLSAFLGRPVDVPQLAPAAPVLDLNKLFIEVMNQGGYTAVTAANGWSGIAFQAQRDADLAEKVQAVYDCYLLPLEQDLPPGFRPARNIDHLDSRIQQRVAMGCRVPTYEAVMYAVGTAAAAMQQVMPWASELCTNVDTDMQQQELPQQAEAQQRQQDSIKVPSQIVCAALRLLRQAAVQPNALAQQLLQRGSFAQLHRLSQDACIAHYRRVNASRRQSQGVTEQEEHNAVATDMLSDLATVTATTSVSENDRSTEAASGGPRVQVEGLAAVLRGTSSEVQQQNVEAAQPDAEQPASTRTSISLAMDEYRVQESMQYQPTAADLPVVDQQQQNAARWLLLSRRALASGPPGCDRPALKIPGMQTLKRSAGRSQADESSSRRATGAGGPAKKAFHGFTPKCGQCRTCLNPSLKKPCVINKARMAQGLTPLLPRSDA